MAEQLLHFSLGPVQRFVGQSRRTRDFWASSFLLSLLVGEALEAILSSELDAECRLPRVEDDDGEPINELIAALRQRGDDDEVCGPRFGVVPNRFQVACEEPKHAANLAEERILEKWEEIAEAVWEDVVAPAASVGNGTREIWDRQIGNFWSIYWIVGYDSNLLDQRKNWRHRFPEPEPGDKCTMMHEWQELSGWCASEGERSRQEEFWSEVRDSGGAHELDFKENERLCAIALVKRMFPRCAVDEIGWDPEATHWPSTAYMAAAPWLGHAADREPAKAKRYAESVLQARPSAKGERYTELPTLQEHGGKSEVGDFFDLDGNFFLEEALGNPSATPLDEDDDLPEGETGENRTALRRRLSDLTEAEEVGAPSRYYAMLLMDGDRMGAILNNAADRGGDTQKAVSRALTAFTQKAGDVLANRDAGPVYAGGDDVLAFVTLPDVFETAVELRSAYIDVFDDISKGDIQNEFTISAGIVLSHYKYPLHGVLDEAHYLLDELAKDETGRDSVALSVLKPGGKQYEWAMPWKQALDDDSRLCLESLADRFADGMYSSSFLYGLRDLLVSLNDEGSWKPGQSIEVEREDLIEGLYGAAYRQSREGGVSDAVVERAVDGLLDASWLCRRKTVDDETTIERQNELGFDAPLLMRFLAKQRTEGSR